MTFKDELDNYYIPGKLYQHHRYGNILKFSKFINSGCEGCKSELGICTGHMLQFINGRKDCPSDNGHRRFIKVKVSNIRW